MSTTGELIETCNSCRFSGTIVAPDKTFNQVCRRRCIATHVLVPGPGGQISLQLFGGFPPYPPGEWCGDWEGKTQRLVS
jgi:hypothetical protein